MFHINEMENFPNQQLYPTNPPNKTLGHAQPLSNHVNNNKVANF